MWLVHARLFLGWLTHVKLIFLRLTYIRLIFPLISRLRTNNSSCILSSFVITYTRRNVLRRQQIHGAASGIYAFWTRKIDVYLQTNPTALPNAKSKPKRFWLELLKMVKGLSMKGDVVPPFQTLMAILNMKKILADQPSLILIMIFFSQWIVNQLIGDIVT